MKQRPLWAGLRAADSPPVTPQTRATLTTYTATLSLLSMCQVSLTGDMTSSVSHSEREEVAGPAPPPVPAGSGRHQILIEVLVVVPELDTSTRHCTVQPRSCGDTDNCNSTKKLHVIVPAQHTVEIKTKNINVH